MNIPRTQSFGLQFNTYTSLNRGAKGPDPRPFIIESGPKVAILSSDTHGQANISTKITLFAIQGKTETDLSPKPQDGSKPLELNSLRRDMDLKRKELKAEEKQNLKNKLKALVEQYKLMHQMLKNDPKTYARYMANMAQELRQLLKAYAKINKDFKDDKDMSIEAPKIEINIVSLGTTQSSEASLESLNGTPDETSDETVGGQDIDSDDISMPDLSEVTPEQVTPEQVTPEQATRFYALVETLSPQGSKDMAMSEEEGLEAKADLMFANEIKAFVKILKEKFQEVKVAHFFSPDQKERDRLNKDADEGFGALEKDLDQFSKDIEKTLPIPGLTAQSVA
jgi:hypothetical protein